MENQIVLKTHLTQHKETKINFKHKIKIILQMEAMYYKVSRVRQKRWALRKDLKSVRGDLRCPVAEGSNNFGAAKAPSPLRCHLVFLKSQQQLLSSPERVGGCMQPQKHRVGRDV